MCVCMDVQMGVHIESDNTFFSTFFEDSWAMAICHQMLTVTGLDPVF